MTSADVRARLTHALRLDLVGPEPGEPQESELLRLPPSRWYLTGFLVPWNAHSTQKSDEDVLIQNAAFGRQLCQQFEALVQSRAVLEVPGFR